MFGQTPNIIFGQRLADHVLNIMELFVESAYNPLKADLLRWLLRLAHDRNVLSGSQYEICCRGMITF